MGQCALAPPANRPTKIVDLDEILFSEVRKELTLAQRMCLGKSLYLEVQSVYSTKSSMLVLNVGRYSTSKDA